MTRRFDRLDGGAKLHMQSLGALAHFDFNNPGAYAYEQAFLVIRQLSLPMAAVEEQFRRMALNIIARNLVKDHYKSHRVQRETPVAQITDAVDASNPERMVVDSDTAGSVRDAVRLLPARQQQVIWLRYWRELTVAESAAALGCRTGAAKALQHRAQRALARLLPQEVA